MSFLNGMPVKFLDLYSALYGIGEKLLKSTVNT